MSAEAMRKLLRTVGAICIKGHTLPFEGRRVRLTVFSARDQSVIHAQFGTAGGIFSTTATGMLPKRMHEDTSLPKELVNFTYGEGEPLILRIESDRNQTKKLRELLAATLGITKPPKKFTHITPHIGVHVTPTSEGSIATVVGTLKTSEVNKIKEAYEREMEAQGKVSALSGVTTPLQSKPPKRTKRKGVSLKVVDRLVEMQERERLRRRQ